MTAPGDNQKGNVSPIAGLMHGAKLAGAAMRINDQVTISGKQSMGFDVKNDAEADTNKALRELQETQGYFEFKLPEKHSYVV